MMSLTFGLFTQVSDSGPQGPLVYLFFFRAVEGCAETKTVFQIVKWGKLQKKQPPIQCRAYGTINISKNVN